MEKGESPSPAPSNSLHQSDDVLHSGFQQLIQHNAASGSYSQLEQSPVDMGSHIGSNPHSRYSSPAPQTNMMAGYGHQSPYPVPPHQGGYQTAYPLEPSPYPQLPETSHNAYSTPATSPSTPVQAEGMTTRSGRAIMRPGAASAPARPGRMDPRPPPKARVKKRKRIIGEDGFPEPSSVSLAGPLSELVKDIRDVMDTDIQAYVNRSPEERRLEVAQSKNGKVKRPMNAFMLYRKAYQNRTKEWKRLDDIRRKEESAAAAAGGGDGKPEKGHDNHQVISQVCGASWNMEPQELRDQYDEWAKVERNNHKLAFPDYKFAPAKSKIKKPAGVVGGVGRSGSPHGNDRDSDDDNASNLDAYDFHEWAQSSSGPPSRNATRSARFMDPDADYVLPPGYAQSAYTSPSPGMQAARLPAGYGVPGQLPHQSSFQYSNPGKPRPADYGSALGQGQYYQQSTEFTQQAYPQHYGGASAAAAAAAAAAAYGIPHPHQHHHQGIPAYVENVYINKTNSPASSFHNSPVLDQHTYNEFMASQGGYAPHIAHPHSAVPHGQPHHHMPRHPHAEHNVDPSLSLMSTRHEPGGGGGGSSNMAHDTTTTYDSLGILGLGHGGDFGTDGLPTYHLDQGSGGGFGGGGSQIESPHPQQFEQAFHTPNDTTTTTTPGADGGGSDPAPHIAEPSWQDTGHGGAADVKIGSSDWETTLGAAAEFQLEDIDQILGTAADSPGG